MKKLKFNFSTKLTFDDYVKEHSFALRCIPLENKVQHIISCDLDISPFVSTKQTVDAFGNNVITGYLKSEHRFLDFEIKGYAEIDSTKEKKDFMPCYSYQSKFTIPDENLKKFYNDIKLGCKSENPFERALYFSDYISDIITYEKSITDTKTTASEAFLLKKGVCQDFSHIMLSLLRMENIACRYIAGLACCDGETHSWIEVWDGNCWRGLDATNNCIVNDDYLVLSQGRDFGDCSIDRGIMMGSYTKQLQLIKSYLVNTY